MKKPYRGSVCPHAKLNEKLVAQIRREYRARQEERLRLAQQYSVAAFARRYGVTKATMVAALRYQTWRHVVE